MFTDLFGNKITTDDPAVTVGVNAFISGFLSYTPVIADVLEVAQKHPSCCLPNAYAGFLWLLLESSEGPQKAQPFIDKAQRAVAGASPREALIVKIAQAWVQDDISTVIQACEQILISHPRDLAILKLAQYHLFNQGDALNMLRLAVLCFEANTEVAHMHAMAAFAYEQCHLLDDAESAARAALQIEPNNPWAHHALAHVFLTRGQIDEGAVFLEDASASWAGLTSFMYTHNWWHLAVFYINRGKMDAALQIYDEHLWTQMKDYSQDQIGAVSMLSRLEMAGVDVGERWAEPGDYIAARGADTTQPFLSLQYLLGLKKAKRPEADIMMQAIAQKEGSSAHPDCPWHRVALPVSKGIVALVDGDYALAVKHFGLALPHLADIGGSHAQRDLFEQLYLEALLKSEHWSKAQQMLEMRRTYDPLSVPINAQLSCLYQGCGLTALAEDRAHRAVSSNAMKETSHV